MFSRSRIPEPSVLFRSIHELSAGDYRIIDFRHNTTGQPCIDTVRFTNAWPVMDDSVQSVRIHIAEPYYLYGTTYTPDGSHSHIYDDLARQHSVDYAILHSRSIADNHTSWSAVPSDQVMRRHKLSGDTALVSSGLSGVYVVAGIPVDATYVWVSIERHNSAVAVVQGPHVLFHMTIPVGTSNLIRSIADMMHSDTDFARTILENYGFMHTHHDSRVRDVLLHAISPVVTAVQQSVSALHSLPYRRSFERQPITTWLLGGAGAGIPGLAEYINLFTGTEQWHGISEQYRQVIQSTRAPITRETLPRYYIALGLMAGHE